MFMHVIFQNKNNINLILIILNRVSMIHSIAQS